jgi:DNA polymerase-4
VTTPRDVKSEEEAFKYLLDLSERVGIRLRRARLRGSVVTVQLKNSSFKTYRHQKKLALPVDTTTEIYENARLIFREMWRGDDLRLIGVQLTALSDAEAEIRQLSFFEDPAESERRAVLEKTQDAIRERYGENAIMRGTLTPDNDNDQ